MRELNQYAFLGILPSFLVDSSFHRTLLIPLAKSLFFIGIYSVVVLIAYLIYLCKFKLWRYRILQLNSKAVWLD